MLENLKSIAKNKSKRVGRGIGSGKGGHTVGKGIKGHKTRSGYKEPRPGFEGGQMPLSRRIPKKKGFKRGHLKQKEGNATLTFNDINSLPETDLIDIKFLRLNNLIKASSKSVKIVNKGNLTKKLNFKGIKVSAPAKEVIEKQGGKVQ